MMSEMVTLCDRHAVIRSSPSWSAWPRLFVSDPVCFLSDPVCSCVTPFVCVWPRLFSAAAEFRLLLNLSHDSRLGSVPGKSQIPTTNPSVALWAIHSLAILRTSISRLARYVVPKARVCCDMKVAVLTLLYHHDDVQSSCVKAPPTDQSIIKLFKSPYHKPCPNNRFILFYR